MHDRDWICERTLREGKRGKRVVVRMERPMKHPDDAWSCHVEIVRGKSAWEHDVFGGDSFQALIIALQVIRAELDKLGPALTWPATIEEGDTGFTMHVPDFLGIGLARRLEAMVVAETERYASQMKGEPSK